jgi:BirA family transcriptional regulator, biotin operon repressor / biotin---[acetyl-CoA-carboxylase] ligase
MLSELRRQSAIDSIRDLGLFQTIVWQAELDSTNRYVTRECKAQRLDLPALVVADRQSQGVGRSGNTWWSPDGCLMFSMALPWSQKNPEAATLPLLVGICVADIITQLTARRALVKWPNDVVVDDRKICGILIESSSQPASTSQPATSHQDVCVIGIGINCRVDFSQAPYEVRSVATSLHEVASAQAAETTTPESVLLQFLTRWVDHHSAWAADPLWVASKWHDWDWLAGRWVQVTLPHSTVQGIAHGIDTSGALIVIDPLSRHHTILSGTVRAL